MDEQQYKLVKFEKYCKKCKHFKKKEVEEPCNECLEEPVNLFSHKPTKFESGDEK